MASEQMGFTQMDNHRIRKIYIGRDLSGSSSATSCSKQANFKVKEGCPGPCPVKCEKSLKIKKSEPLSTPVPVLKSNGEEFTTSSLQFTFPLLQAATGASCSFVHLRSLALQPVQ